MARKVPIPEEMRKRVKSEVQRLLNVPEAATLLCVSPNTLRQWISQRRVPVVKLGKAVRFAPDDLQKFIEEHKREVVTL